jgi:DNA-binding CsgD family transcriptional regulator
MDIGATIEEIYEAVGDADRWQRLNERLAAAPQVSPDIVLHLETARRAHEQHTRVAADIDTLARVHDQLALGAIVVDCDGRLLRANATAARLFADGDGLMLIEGRIRASNTRDDDRLRDALDRAAAGAGHADDPDMAFVDVARQGQAPLRVVTVPSATRTLLFFESGLPLTLLIIDPDQAPTPSGDTLRALFSFTAREAEFAGLLIRGVSVKDASIAMGVSLTTARTFLARVTAKTDTHSQAELMVRLSAIPAAPADNPQTRRKG